MHTEKTLKNSAISVGAQIITLLLQFINRRVFIQFLDVEYLGYHSLFGNIFSILSIAELGIGTIISFHLYKEVIDKNEEEIGRLMFLYKWLYRAVAVVVCIFGIIISFFLQSFVKDSTVTKTYLYTIYFLQLTSVVVGYFLSYRRNILFVTQQEYRCVRIDLYVNVVIQFLQLLLLWLLHNYIVYLFLQISTSIISNYIIKKITDREYPYLNQNYLITKEYIKNKNIVSDAGNFILHKVAYAVYCGTDNIVISAFCGVKMVALYGSYVTLRAGVQNILFYNLLNPLQATIGNIVYADNNSDQLWKQFKAFDLFSFFFASYFSMGFFLFLQPTIQLWMGPDYLLPMSFVILFVSTAYFGAVWEIVYKYRSVFGDFKQDRNMMILSAVLNVSISIPSAMRWGIAGVQLGTLIAFFPIAIGRIRFIVKNYFKQSMGRYMLKHVFFTIVVILEGVFCYIFTYTTQVTLFGIILRVVAWIFIPGVFCFIVGLLFPERKLLLQYAKRIGIILNNRIKSIAKKY